MDPALLIVSALALGASAGVKYVAETGLKDAYTALKELISRKYPSVFVDRLEKMPTSDEQQQAVEKVIKESGVDKDNEVVLEAQKLIEKINELSPDLLPTLGVNLEDVRAVSVSIEDITSSGTGVQIKGSQFEGDINIKKVKAGPPPKA